MSDAHLVLIGMMGAGKTTVGQRCAARLDRPFIDTDDLVAVAAGKSVAEIFEREGEAGFREREQIAVQAAINAPVPAVIACGGGAVLDAGNVDVLRTGGVVVWLRTGAGELAHRIGDDGARPLLAGDAPGMLTRLTTERAAAYERAAHAIVDTDNRTADEVAALVLRAYTETPR